MKLAAVIGLAAVLLAGAIYFLSIKNKVSQECSALSYAMSQRVELKTKDSVSIVADYYAPASPSAKGLLLLHMMPADRRSWRVFADKMQAAGWHVLAIDLRGHGESQGGPPGTSLAKGGPNGYKSFSDAEHQASRWDVEAGAEFLRSKGVAELSLGGASIGANLALRYLTEHPDTKAAFLLSPGLDYRGVKTEYATRSLKAGQAVYYIASRDDAYSAETIQKLFDTTPPGVKKDIKFFQAAGHGTTIFEKEPEFMGQMVSWLQKVAP